MAGSGVIRVAGFSLQHGYHTETPTHIETRTHNQCGDTIESRRLLMMDVLMSETC